MTATPTVAELIAYAADLGTTIADDDATAEGLVRAEDYIEYYYLNRLVISAPDELVENAIYEAAILEIATPGFFTKTFTASEQTALTEVKGIKWTLVGDASGAEAATPVSTKIEAMFYPYMQTRGGPYTMLLTLGGCSE